MSVSGRVILDIPLIEKLEAIEQRLSKIEGLLTRNIAKEQATLEPISQKAAMLKLRISFPTFKRLLLEFHVKPIKRGSRLFYRQDDIAIIVNGQK
jgi:hypothetical protein